MRAALDAHVLVRDGDYYRFYIAQTALGTTWSIAMAIAMIDFLLQVNYLFALSQISGLWLPAS